MERFKRQTYATLLMIAVASCRKPSGGPSGAPSPARTPKIDATSIQATRGTTDNHAPVGSDAAHPSGNDGPWIEEVRRLAGEEPIFLVRSPTGTIFARTPSGRAKSELISSNAKLPLLDGSLELLWLREGRTLDVVDLRATKPARIHIARALPEPAAFDITRTVEDTLVHIGRPPACPTDVLILLDWLSEPTLTIDREGEPETREDRKARLVGKAWLDANRGRAGGVHPSFLDPWRNGERFVAEIPASMKKCHPALDCSRMINFGPAGWLLFIVQGDDEDECPRYTCMLFDPAKKTFASPLDPLKWGKADSVAPMPCGTFFFEPSGRRYLSAGKVCDMVEGCADIGGEALGWLPTGAWILIGRG